MNANEPVAYGMLTFCKNCGEQNPYAVKEMNDKPVAWIDPKELDMDVSTSVTKTKQFDGDIPLYTHPSKELTDAQNTIRQLAEKLECYERLADASEMASNPMGVKSREALRNVREMKTIMTKEEEILRAVEAEREACAEIADRLPRIYRETKEAHHRNSLEPFHPSQFGFDFAEIQQAEVITHAIRARSKHD